MVKDLTIQVLIKKVEELARRIDRSEKENKILCHENAFLINVIVDMSSQKRS